MRFPFAQSRVSQVLVRGAAPDRGKAVRYGGTRSRMRDSSQFIIILQILTRFTFFTGQILQQGHPVPLTRHLCALAESADGIFGTAERFCMDKETPDRSCPDSSPGGIRLWRKQVRGYASPAMSVRVGAQRRSPNRPPSSRARSLRRAARVFRAVMRATPKSLAKRSSVSRARARPRA